MSMSDTQLIILGSGMGAIVGILGAATGMVAGLSSQDNRSSLRRLHIMFLVDIRAGILLVIAGLLSRALVVSEAAKGTAEAALYAGSILLGVIGLCATYSGLRGLAPGELRHVLPAAGLLFLLLALHSWLAAGNNWLALREAVSAGTLLVVYALISFFGRLAKNSKPRHTPTIER